MFAKTKFSLLSIPGIQAVLIFLALSSSWADLAAAPRGDGGHFRGYAH